MDKQLTIGEERVRTAFNPSAEGIVDKIKQMSAELINMCEELKIKDGRCASIAQTEFETACMYAVKAATASVNTSPRLVSSTGPVTETR